MLEMSVGICRRYFLKLIVRPWCHAVDVTDRFTYLGIDIRPSSCGPSTAEMFRRIGLASSVMGQLTCMAAVKTTISLNIKLRLYCTTPLSSPSYCTVQKHGHSLNQMNRRSRHFNCHVYGTFSDYVGLLVSAWAPTPIKKQLTFALRKVYFLFNFTVWRLSGRPSRPTIHWASRCAVSFCVTFPCQRQTSMSAQRLTQYKYWTLFPYLLYIVYYT